MRAWKLMQRQRMAAWLCAHLHLPAIRSLRHAFPCYKDCCGVELQHDDGL